MANGSRADIALKSARFLSETGCSCFRLLGSMKRRFVLLAYLFAAALPVQAVDPGTAIEAATVAKGSVPGLVRAGKGIVEVPWQVAQCLRLPLGIVQMVFSPLPGVDFSDGLENTGKGIVAPFKLCVATLEMPYEVFGGLGDSITGLVK